MTKLRWAKKKILIAVRDCGACPHSRPLVTCETHPVSAIVLGYFGLHEAVYLASKKYTLTHIPTGRIAGQSNSHAALRRLAESYSAALGERIRTKGVKQATKMLTPIYQRWRANYERF